ncbi:MAG: tetratricopeptide repeat protein, partial [Thermodesulfobacteriota bacterium]
MNRRALLWVLLSVVAVMIHPSVAHATQIVLDSEKQMEFVRHYMEREEYDRAAQELERLTYFFPDDSRVPEARCMTGWCYLKLRRFERARRILWEVHESYSPGAPSEKALFLIGESCRLQGDIGEAVYYFQRVLTDYPQAEAADEAQYRIGLVHMEVGQWHEASRTFEL